MKSVIISTGRMNPPTKGHIHLIETMKRLANEEKTEAVLCLTKTTGNEKNPLTYEEKKRFLEYTGVGFADDCNVFKTVERMTKEEKYEEFFFVIGSDRMSMMESVGKYALEWGAKKIHFIELARDEQNELSKISATKVRKAVKENDYETYEKMIGVQEKDVQPLWNLLRERLTN